MKTINAYLLLTCLFIYSGCAQHTQTEPEPSENPYSNMTFELGSPLEYSDADWQDRLSEHEYKILRKKGTERAFTGDLLDNKAQGYYVCAGCGLVLFDSETKYDSGSGWPSFYAAYDDHIDEHHDSSFGMSRVEVICKKCGGHLGHLFTDGPKPTGMRYCINAASLDFYEKEK